MCAYGEGRTSVIARALLVKTGLKNFCKYLFWKRQDKTINTLNLEESMTEEKEIARKLTVRSQGCQKKKKKSKDLWHPEHCVRASQ